MLPAQNRLRSSKDFAKTTKVGHRASTESLVIYLHQDPTIQSAPQVGFIISKVVGGSVTRHRIARQLRHAAQENIGLIPDHSHLVIRVIKNGGDFATELHQGFVKINQKLGARQ